MKLRLLALSLGCASLLGCASTTTVPAQSYPQGPVAQAPGAPATSPYAQQELDQMLAPIALYPDALLAQVLMAATYPLEVVQASRFVQSNPSLAGDALARAVEPMPWDPSVKALVQFPSVLAMMSDQLDWTERLGEAFLAQREQVMATVQALRARAHEQGTLRSNDQQRVVIDERVIYIEPWQAGYYWVPYYNPLVVYGTWWWPAYQPFFWVPPVIYRPPLFPAVYTVGIVWGPLTYVYPSLWYDPRPVWPGRYVVVNNVRVTNVIVTQASTPQPYVWDHDPAHRRGVDYRTPVVRDRYVTDKPVRGAMPAPAGRTGASRIGPAPRGPAEWAPGSQPPLAPAARPGMPAPPAMRPIVPGKETPGVEGGPRQFRDGDPRQFRDGDPRGMDAPAPGGQRGGFQRPDASREDGAGRWTPALPSDRGAAPGRQAFPGEGGGPARALPPASQQPFRGDGTPGQPNPQGAAPFYRPTPQAPTYRGEPQAPAFRGEPQAPMLRGEPRAPAARPEPFRPDPGSGYRPEPSRSAPAPVYRPEPSRPAPMPAPGYRSEPFPRSPSMSAPAMREPAMREPVQRGPSMPEPSMRESVPRGTSMREMPMRGQPREFSREPQGGGRPMRD